MEHFDTIHGSPSNIYHSALSLSPSPILHSCYSPEIKVIKGLPAEWGVCFRTVLMDSYTLALSYCNNSIAIGSSSGDIIILDTTTGAQTAVLHGHTNEVNCVAFSSDGTSLVSGSDDKTVKLWDMQTGGVVKTFLGHTEQVWSVSISVDHTTVASGSHSGTICLWDVKTGGCHHTIKQPDTVFRIRFSPTDPQHLISVSHNQVWQWDANGHKIKPPFNGQHISFSSNGAQFVSSNEKTVTIHNSNSGAIVAEFQITGSDVYGCSFSPDSRLVAVGAGATVYCWDITSSKPQLVETFIGHTGNITSLVFSSPTTLISVSGDRSAKFWQIGTQSIDSAIVDPKYTPLPSATIVSLTLQAKYGIVITSDLNGVVSTWDVLTGMHNTSSQTPAKDCKSDVQQLNERLILVYHTDEKIHVWDVGNEKLLLKVDKVYESVEDLRISGDGLKIFSLCAPSIRAWSIQTGEAMGEVEIGYWGGGGTLTVSGSKVWVHWPQLEHKGWDFGILGSAPTQLFDIPTLSDGSMLWDPRQGRIKNMVTGKVVFQFSGRFANPIDVQCGSSYLGARYGSGVILILDLGHILL